jgi:putative ABC transport system permease protein
MVVEVALAVILLTGAGLMGRTMLALTSVDPGFDPTHLLTLRYSIDGSRATPELDAALDRRVNAFTDRVLEDVRATPGVTAASVSLSLPIEGSNWGSVFIIDGDPTPTLADTPTAAWEPISDGYFNALRMRVVAGREFGPADNATSQNVVMVNQEFVRAFLHGGPAIGRRIRQGWPGAKSPLREIVGVVRDVSLNGIDQAVYPEIYMPLKQHPVTYGALVVRSAGDPTALLPAVRAIIGKLDPTLPLFEVQTMGDLVAANIARQRLTMLIFIGFGALALVLACVGLYGVIAHGVSARTREIGVRLALGASGRQVMTLFVGQGLVTTGIGLAIGAGAGLALAKIVESQGLLFHVTGRDPASFVTAMATLLVVSIVACYVPAKRASRVDPTVTLRGD